MDFEDIPYAGALTEDQAERVRQLVSEGLTLEQRWLRYGEAYGSGAAGGDPLTRVREAVSDRLAELRAHLCGDSGLLKVAGSPATGVALSLAFAVTGKLVSVKFQDVDVVQLGVLIAQAGLFAVCSGQL